MSETTLEDQLKRGAEAQQLIENPIFREALDAIEKEIDDLFTGIDTTDEILCADLIRRRQVCEAFKQMLIRYIQTGKYAKEDIEEKEKEREPRFFER